MNLLFSVRCGRKSPRQEEVKRENEVKRFSWIISAPAQELRRRTAALKLQEEERIKEQKEMEVRFLTVVVDIGLLNQRLLEFVNWAPRKLCILI